MFKDGIILLNGTNELQKINLGLSCDIVFAFTADPYVAILTAEGQIVLVVFVGDRLVPTLTQLHKASVWLLLLTIH